MTIAYRRACLNAIEYLKNFGHSGEQAYTILSCAPVEGRVGGFGKHAGRDGHRHHDHARSELKKNNRPRIIGH